MFDYERSCPCAYCKEEAVLKIPSALPFDDTKFYWKCPKCEKLNGNTNAVSVKAVVANKGEK